MPPSKHQVVEQAMLAAPNTARLDPNQAITRLVLFGPDGTPIDTTLTEIPPASDILLSEEYEAAEGPDPIAAEDDLETAVAKIDGTLADHNSRLESLEEPEEVEAFTGTIEVDENTWTFENGLLMSIEETDEG